MSEHDNPFLSALPLTQQCVKDQCEIASDTPRTDAVLAKYSCQQPSNNELSDLFTLCRQLERENADLRKQLAEAQAENTRLREVMVAAAEELGAHWDAHCDAEGYGPVNLERRLLEGIAEHYPGYTVGEFAKLQARAESAEARVKFLESAWKESAEARLREVK